MLNSVDTPCTPWVDPIVAQLHSLREQLSAQHGNDMAEISRAAGRLLNYLVRLSGFCGKGFASEDESVNTRK